MSKPAPINLLSRAFNTPLLLEPSYASFMVAYMGQRAGATELMFGGQVLDPEQHAESFQSKEKRLAGGKYRPYALHENGVAQIAIEGSLAHKFGGMEPSSGMQGYDGIRKKLELAVADDRVRGIMLDVDSPGGEVSGAFDIARLIKEVNEIKPVAAVSDEMMASAAFLISAHASAIYVGKTSRVGSVGAVLAHHDYSKNLEDAGVRVTLITAGEHKADGNPYEALPESVEADLQSSLENVRADFAQEIAEGRGMKVQKVLDTEARVYTGQEAKDIGFADYVLSSMEDAPAHFGRRINAINKKRTQVMSKADIGDQELIDAARAEGHAEGLKLGQKQAEAQAEKLVVAAEAEKLEAAAQAKQEAKQEANDRAVKVMAAATGKEAMAGKLLASEMDADAIIEVLEAAPAASAANSAAGLSQAANVEKPEASAEETAAAESAALMAEITKKMVAKGLMTGSAK